MNELFEIIKEKDESFIKNHGGIWSISRREIDLEAFLDFVIEYFELESVIKDKWAFDFPNEGDFMRQKHKYLNYVRYLLDTIKPMLLLAFKLSELKDTSEMFETNKITEDAIVNMIDNFLNLNRSGRNRKIPPHTLENFKKFKEEFGTIISFFKELKRPKVKSIKDYIEVIKEFNITLTQLRNYKRNYDLKFKRYIANSSKKTLYRYDKDLIFVEKTIVTMKWLETQWSLYKRVDKAIS